MKMLMRRVKSIIFLKPCISSPVFMIVGQMVNPFRRFFFLGANGPVSGCALPKKLSR